MKFTDGNWLLQPGLQAHHPAEAYEVSQVADALVVVAPTRRIRHRGDTLQGPLLTIRLDSPLADVVRVRIEHLRGRPDQGPSIPLQECPSPAVVIDTTAADQAVLRTGALSAQIARGENWELAFKADGHVLTRSAARGIGFVEGRDRTTFVHERLALGVGECVYGFGERFTAFVKNGQVVDNWNKDGGTCSEQAYKSVPFYLTNRGYGVLVSNTGPVSFEVASERVSQVQFSVPGESLEYFLIYGPTPKEILQKLTQLTGRPALPPAWSFGLWLTTSFTTSYDEATVTQFIDGMKQRDLPLHVFHFDCFWMREFRWCDFEWDPRTFADPAGLLRRLHERGLKVSVWINPYIAQLSPLFEEGRRQGYLLRKANGEVWQSDLWQPGMAIVDFTNPGARDWYTAHLRRLLEMGVDCFKTDFGERIPTDVVYHDGSDPVRMHNHYSVIYNEAVFRLIEEVRGAGNAVVFARSSHASGQRFPVHWGGDCHSTFESMAESLRGGLSLGLCGFGFWSHDIGGFEGLPDPAVYKRWVAFGLLSSHSRLHGSSSYRVPWVYNDEACDVLRFFTKLKCRLMPYLYGAAVTAHQHGVPVMRPMMLEYPHDPACANLERQYFLGDSILVAPVLSEDGLVDYYLPEGNWTHLLTGEVVAGGRWCRTQHDFLSLPVFARPGAVIPFGAQDNRPDYPLTEGVTFRAYQIADGAVAECEVPTLAGLPGIHLKLERHGAVLNATLSGSPAGAWRLQLPGVAALKSVAGGKPFADPAGVVVVPDPQTRQVSITLGA
ncbi:alpha-xylosidase [Opitutus sp. ER46]|uniref:alpha-xylosidase n=1 Tax=Opitutus sp. ER46 TaxID=2161864 RepID=UPI000D3276BF|nr:alpha-xylosidase [Opitutus sp. ER46]PTX92661.1 alpha-xylosidase [Opitutus sp. ER46]